MIEPSAPFRLDLTAWALRRRAHNEIDRWDGRAYRRALPLESDATALTVTEVGVLDAPRLAVTLAGDPIDPLPETQARALLDRLLGLEVDHSGFAAMAAADPSLAGLGLEEHLDYDGVESAVSRWAPYAGLVYFHLLLDSLSQAGLVS